MSEAALKCATQEIVVDDVLPHAPEMIWKTLTTGELIGRWLMQPTGFAPVKGTRFTFQTTPAGAWDGVVHCEVLEVSRNEALSFSWQGGRDSNAHYGSRLDTVVTWTLARVDGGTRLRLVHSGFVTPRNDAAFKNMSEGWKRVVGRIGVVSGEHKAQAIPSSRRRLERRTSRCANAHWRRDRIGGQCWSQSEKKQSQMVDILHKVGIESSSLDQAYEALTTREGRSGRWTSDMQGDSNKVGGGRLGGKDTVPAGEGLPANPLSVWPWAKV